MSFTTSEARQLLTSPQSFTYFNFWNSVFNPIVLNSSGIKTTRISIDEDGVHNRIFQEIFYISALNHTNGRNRIVIKVTILVQHQNWSRRVSHITVLKIHVNKGTLNYSDRNLLRKNGTNSRDVNLTKNQNKYLKMNCFNSRYSTTKVEYNLKESVGNTHIGYIRMVNF